MRFLLAGLPLITACGAIGATDNDAPTWNGEVLALMEEHCVSCHVDGGIAPMALDTYESLEADTPSGGQPVHSVIVPYIESGLMPPYGSMAECIPYVGDHADLVEDDELEVIKAWLEAERPLGEEPAIHYEPPPSDADGLGEPDYVVRNDTPHQPSYGSDGSEYACFVIDPELDQSVWINAITPKVDNKRIVHHMLLFKAPPGTSSRCNGSEMLNDLIAGWAPGQDGWFLPDGVAFKMEPGEVFQLQIHYDATNDNGKDDRSGMNLYYTDSAEHEAGVLWTGAVIVDGEQNQGGFGEFVIPADEPAHEVKGTCTLNSLHAPDGEMYVFGAWPHMHLLGSHMEAYAQRISAPDQCLVESRFSFEDQRGYRYREPVLMKPGDTIHTTCTFDNSSGNPNNPYDPPRDIHWGEETDNEMCFNFLMYYPAQDVQWCVF